MLTFLQSSSAASSCTLLVSRFLSPHFPPLQHLVPQPGHIIGSCSSVNHKTTSETKLHILFVRFFFWFLFFVSCFCFTRTTGWESYKQYKTPSRKQALNHPAVEGVWCDYIIFSTNAIRETVFPRSEPPDRGYFTPERTLPTVMDRRAGGDCGCV